MMFDMELLGFISIKNMKNIIFGGQNGHTSSKVLSKEVNPTDYDDNCFWSTYLALVNMGSRLLLH